MNYPAAPQAGSLLRSDKLRGIKPYKFRIVLQMIRVIRVICEICGLKLSVKMADDGSPRFLILLVSCNMGYRRNRKEEVYDGR